MKPKKGLNTPKERADDPMATRKKTKKQITIYKLLHRNQKIEQHDTPLPPSPPPPQKPGVTLTLRKGSQFLFQKRHALCLNLTVFFAYI